jgi:hypothetical protein
MVVKPVFTKGEDVGEYRVLGQVGGVYLALHRERGTLVALEVCGAEKLRLIDHDPVRYLDLLAVGGLLVLVRTPQFLARPRTTPATPRKPKRRK